MLKKRVEITTEKECSEKEWENGKFKGNTSKPKTINANLNDIDPIGYTVVPENSVLMVVNKS